jgi:Fungal Zn(2)-Cys(6) binuclear cluster domain
VVSRADGDTLLRFASIVAIVNSSVGHCRRRKIRCLLPTPEDPQGRCANCIRLKKECNFHPVDHATDLRTGRKESAAGLSPSSTSSPHTPIPPGQLSALESQTGASYDQGGSIPPPQSDDYTPSFINGSRSLSMPYMSSGMSNDHIPLQPTFTLSSADEAPDWPGSGFIPNSMSQSSPSSNYWASGDNTPNTSTFPTNLLNQPASAYGPSTLAFQTGTHSWAPSRSASFSGFENLHQSYTYPDLPPQSELSSYSLEPGTPNTSSLSPPPIGHAIPVGGVSHLLPSGDMSSSLPYQQQQQPPPPWISPDPLHAGAPSWFAEPSSIINPDLQDHIRDPFSNTGSPVYPNRTNTS